MKKVLSLARDITIIGLMMTIFLLSPNPAQAVVAHDATSESHTGNNGSINQASFTWTHTPAGTPRGVLVFVYTISATKTVTSVMYGGIAMTEITSGTAIDTTAEPGRVDTFFLGSSIPTGARSIVINRVNNGVEMYATASTQTAGADTEVYTTGIVLLQQNGAYAEQSVTDGSTGVNSVRYAAGYYGGNNVLPVGASSTALNSIDLGSHTANMARETTAGQGARNVGFTNGTSDDRAGVHLAVREVIPPTVTTLASGTDPSATTIAPGASVSDVNNFTLQTNIGTESVTSVTVNLSTNSGVGRLAITDNSNVELGFTTSPLTGSNTISVSGMSAGTSIATFKVRVTPLSHTSMPAVPGGAYAVTALVTSFTGSYTHTGSDTNVNALTIDNASPANASSVGGSAGSGQVTVNWTNPADSDFHSVVVLRRATSAVLDVPGEGTTYSVGNTIGTATVACVVASPTATCVDSGLSNGTAYHYKVFSRDNFANYAAGVVPTGSPFTPSITTFAITATAGLNGSVAPSGVTNVAQGEDQIYTITASTGYIVATLTIDSISVATSTSYTFTNVQAPHTIDATFSVIYTLTSTAGVGGSITPLGTIITTPGSSQTYTITPDLNYNIASLSIDGVAIATRTTYTFTNILSNHTIDATFVVTPPPPGSFSIVATSGSGGMVSPLGASIVTQGNSQAYTITPNTGYQITTLAVDNISIATTTTYIFNNVQANHTIEATFGSIPGFTFLDTGASRPTTITFRGYAFPGGKATVINKTLNTEKLLTQSSLIQEDGAFSVSFSGILQTLQSFGLIVKDRENRTSQTKYFTYDTRSDNYVFKDILVPPTIDLISGQVSRGANAIIVGYATPDHLVRLELDGIITRETPALSDGSYKFEIPTGVLEFGSHTVKTKQFNPTTKLGSDSSLTRTFIISRLLVVKADLSGDGKIDIQDWSIFLSRWGSRDSTIKQSIDLNGDGKVDIADFSIFIKTIRK